MKTEKQIRQLAKDIASQLEGVVPYATIKVPYFETLSEEREREVPKKSFFFGTQYIKEKYIEKTPRLVYKTESLGGWIIQSLYETYEEIDTESHSIGEKGSWQRDFVLKPNGDIKFNSFGYAIWYNRKRNKPERFESPVKIKEYDVTFDNQTDYDWPPFIKSIHVLDFDLSYWYSEPNINEFYTKTFCRNYPIRYGKGTGSAVEVCDYGEGIWEKLYSLLPKGVARKPVSHPEDENREPEACYQLAMGLMLTAKGPEDVERAIQLLESAAMRGHSSAVVALERYATA